MFKLGFIKDKIDFLLLKSSSQKKWSCSGIGMAFLFSLFAVFLLSGTLRLIQDYIIFEEPLPSIFAFGQIENKIEIQFEEERSEALNAYFWQKANPFSLSVAQAAILEKPVMKNYVLEQVGYSPNIRVGLFYSNLPQTIKASGNYKIITSDGRVVLSSRGEQAVKIWYDQASKLYYFQHGELEKSFNNTFQVVGEVDSILEIVDYYNPPHWNSSLPDNHFRGSLEIYYSSRANRTWIINELPIEYYLRGLGETQARDQQEYLKTMTIVGRSYAYYHMLNDYKHKIDNFHVDAYFDQVYQGYDNEGRHPELIAAVAATHGEVVWYDNQVAVTPYFARSNGYTKSWSEVWHQDPYPWVKPVKVPQETGFSQLGHGVGLSAIGAMIMASEGQEYKEIINYFFDGIIVAPAY